MGMEVGHSRQEVVGGKAKGEISSFPISKEISLLPSTHRHQAKCLAIILHACCRIVLQMTHIGSLLSSVSPLLLSQVKPLPSSLAWVTAVIMYLPLHNLQTSTLVLRRSVGGLGRLGYTVSNCSFFPCCFAKHPSIPVLSACEHLHVFSLSTVSIFQLLHTIQLGLPKLPSNQNESLLLGTWAFSPFPSKTLTTVPTQRFSVCLLHSCPTPSSP